MGGPGIRTAFATDVETGSCNVNYQLGRQVGETNTQAGGEADRGQALSEADRGQALSEADRGQALSEADRGQALSEAAS